MPIVDDHLAGHALVAPDAVAFDRLRAGGWQLAAGSALPAPLLGSAELRSSLGAAQATTPAALEPGEEVEGRLGIWAAAVLRSRRALLHLLPGNWDEGNYRPAPLQALLTQGLLPGLDRGRLVHLAFSPLPPLPQRLAVGVGRPR